MVAKKILILGAGAGGSIVANKLAKELRSEIAKEEVGITILDKEEVSTNQAGFTFIPFGFYTPDDIRRNRRGLISPRIEAVFGKDGEVSDIDLKNREVRVESGKKYTYDYLLIATGCELSLGNIPGLSRDFNSFYTSLEDALRLGDLIKTFNSGRIVILTPKMPIACPGAPSKFAILLDDYLRYVKGEKIREKIDIIFLWPIELVGPSAYNANIDKAFEEKGIEAKKEFKLSKIDENKKEVVSADGERIKYDLLITIPLHRSIKALIDSGITDEKGWIPTDNYTLQYRKSAKERYDEVYAIGDTGPAEILKTGIGAHYQALITAQNLINDILGKGMNGIKVPYRGETGCPYIGASYTAATKGEAYLATWTYNKPLGPFSPTKMGWFVYRMYYYIYWDAAIKALM